ncbi:macrolide family glycosyltransferase [Paenibacillus sp. GCM10023248]|uniref:macrolide family glycosyltransferase n=1 Tax=Bacillales TaxID=1385 RepID=UPI0023788943|nr:MULTISPECIES: macrolide family glycosyltransferase [Bacillales]MDD9269367.1 glycosyltransferase [Paenibacillus sp. MAHUQ-63]MDR6881013.1 MGT family glycosyltransferase [Bacillus sp. 3255]
MARVLFINAGSEGHINPTIGVVQELVSRGEEVVYFAIEAYRERLEKAGASVRTFDETKFIKAFLSGGRNYALERINGLLHTADIVIPSVLDQIQDEHFDYMIHDSMFGCGRILAQILKLPAINSCTSFAQTQEAFDSMLERFKAEVPAEIVTPIYDQFQSLAGRISDRYAVEIQTPYEVFCNPAPLTIVYTTREFQPDGQAFDQSYTFVGPSIAPRVHESIDLPAIQGKKCIYISLGTVFNQAVEFYKLCMEAFGNTEHSIVMSVGNRTPITDLGEIPPNFIVRNYVPQTDVLQNAALFITHGGMNSTHEGLYYGVPLIVIPQSADQPIIAGRVAGIGAGIRLHMQSLTANQLREAAERVLNDAFFKEAVFMMKETFQKSGGYRQAVDEIFQFTSQYRI